MKAVYEISTSRTWVELEAIIARCPAIAATRKTGHRNETTKLCNNYGFLERRGVGASTEFRMTQDGLNNCQRLFG